jgi:SRSO17 transposase
LRFSQKSKNSTAGAHQYSGNQGKTANFQLGVLLGVSGLEDHGIVDYEMFVPKKWFEEKYAELRKKCPFPENLEFQTKMG